MAPFVGVYMFCSTSGAAEKWPHFSFPKTEKKWPRKLKKMAPTTTRRLADAATYSSNDVKRNWKVSLLCCLL